MGEKTALNLLHQYGDLDNTFAHIAELKGALKTKMENGKESAYLSKKLGTIVTVSDIEPGDLTVKEPNRESLEELLNRYQLAKLAAKWNLSTSSAPKKESFSTPETTPFDGTLPQAIPSIYCGEEKIYRKSTSGSGIRR